MACGMLQHLQGALYGPLQYSSLQLVLSSNAITKGPLRTLHVEEL